MLYQYYPTVPHPYRFELNKDMALASAHLNPHPTAGKASQLHGHTFIVSITIVGNNLLDSGFLVSFGMINELVHDKLDHTLLNDHPEFSDVPPTTEGIAKAVFGTIKEALLEYNNQPKLLQVLVRENPSSYVIYREEV